MKQRVIVSKDVGGKDKHYCSFKTEMGNPSSNSTWNKMECISTRGYQIWCIYHRYAFLSTAWSLKTATDSSIPKVGNSSTKTLCPLHHSIDKKHKSLHVKFSVRFVISFTRKPVFIEKYHSSRGGDSKVRSTWADLSTNLFGTPPLLSHLATFNLLWSSLFVIQKVNPSHSMRM
jgi:hypothetical protein